jgi:cobalt-zinc-cadmium resistance protein CzcA
LNELLKHKSSLNYYEVKAVPQADVIIENANKSFTNGAIDYIEYIQAMNQALEIKSNYLNTLNNYNQAVINLEYLINQ